MIGGKGAGGIGGDGGTGGAVVLAAQLAPAAQLE